MTIKLIGENIPGILSPSTGHSKKTLLQSISEDEEDAYKLESEEKTSSPLKDRQLKILSSVQKTERPKSPSINVDKMLRQNVITSSLPEAYKQSVACMRSIIQVAQEDKTKAQGLYDEAIKACLMLPEHQQKAFDALQK